MSQNLRPRPSFHDWLMLAIAAVFVAAGLVILPHDRDTGITTLAFFGSCFAVFASIIVRKLRYRRFGAPSVRVTGGVPIRPRKGLMVLLGAWLLVLGIVLIVFTHEAPALITLLHGAVAVTGAVLLAGAATGKIPGGYLQFDTDHLTIAHRAWLARIPWECIRSVVEADYQSNPVLLLDVADPAALIIEPAQARPRALKSIAHMQAYMGGDFAVMATHYGVDLPVLAGSITRYASEPAARAELAHRPVAGASQLGR